jgi:anti-sigma-K factor RskA
MSHDEREEQASLYALGLLEGAELAAFERALAADPSLAALVTDFENAGFQIALAAPKATPPPAVKDAVLREISDLRRSTEPAPVPAESSSPRISFGWVPWALAAGFAIFAGITRIENAKISAASTRLASDIKDRDNQLIQGETERSALRIAARDAELKNVELTSRITTLESQRKELQDRVSTLEAEKNHLSVRVAALEGSNPLDEVKAITFASQPGAPRNGAVSALWDARRQTGVLDLSKLPAPAADKDYQLWILTPDSPAPISAGVVSTASTQANFRAPRPFPQVAALAISLEPKGGSDSPRGPVIFVGKF